MKKTCLGEMFRKKGPPENSDLKYNLAFYKERQKSDTSSFIRLLTITFMTLATHIVLVRVYPYHLYFSTKNNSFKLCLN